MYACASRWREQRVGAPGGDARSSALDRAAAHGIAADRARHPRATTRSFISVVMRHAPAFALGPDAACESGMRTSCEEHLVELGVAGDLHERAHLDAGRVHVDDEVA